MKLTKSSFEILDQQPGLEGIYKQIEIGARNCYKSEDKITDDSAEKMVEFLKNRGHYSPLEHGTVYMFIPFFPLNENYSTCLKYSDNKYSVVKIRNEHFLLEKNGCYITTNYRVLVENNWLEDLKYLCKPTEYHEKRVSVMITCPVGISREFNRHRTLSVSEQSTRYCNYSKDKFGSEITFVIPEWVKKHDYFRCGEEYAVNRLNKDVSCWYKLLEESEKSYLNLISNGAKPQEARDILPLATATTVIYTGFVSDWKHFFELRTSAGAHPDARAIATPLHSTFIQRKYIVE